MKLVFSVLLFCIFLCPLSHATDDSLSLAQRDKRFHFYGSASGTLITALALRELGASQLESILYSSLIVFSAGLIKEVTDSTFSTNDMATNGLGILTGGLVAGIVIQF